MAANRGYAPLPTESKSVVLLLHQFAMCRELFKEKFSKLYTTLLWYALLRGAAKSRNKAQSYLDTALRLPHIFMLVKSGVHFVAFPYLS